MENQKKMWSVKQIRIRESVTFGEGISTPMLAPSVARGFDEINKRMKSKGSRELQEES